MITKSRLSGWRECLFWQKVRSAGPAECWIWSAALMPGGYGAFGVGGELPTRVAHRIAWILLRGELPPELVLDHLCRTRACVNPWHLEPVTRAVNVARGEGIGARAVRTNRCNKGHPYTAQNTRISARKTRFCRACDRDRTRTYRERKAVA